MRDFLPALYEAHGTQYRQETAEQPGLNCIPWMLHNNEIGVCPRNEFTDAAEFTPSASADRGRGVVTFAGDHTLYLDQDTYYYDGGSQDLTATTGNGYADNTGFNEEYTASFVQHRVSGVTNLVIVNAGHTSTHASANHGNVWYVADSSTAPSSVSDADMPGNNGVSLARGGASLDGYFIVMDVTGKVHHSDLNDITAWTAANFITAEREADIGIYCGRHHDSVVAIGTQSIEFFYNAGNATGSTLSRRTDVYHSVGCYYPNSIVEVGDTIYFIGTEKGTGWTRLYALSNHQLVPISDARIEERLRGIGGNFPDITALDSLDHQVWMSFMTTSDSTGLIFTNDYLWTYYWHEKTNTFHRWEFGASETYVGGITTSNWTQILPIVSYSGTSGGSLSVTRYQLANGRVVYEGTPANDAMNDWGASNALDIYIQFPRWDAGTDKKKRITSIRVITAPSSISTITSNPMNVDLRWADYGKVNGNFVVPTNYNTARTLDLNVRGSRVMGGGTTRERSFILDWPLGHGPVTVVKGLEIDYEIVGE